MSVFCNYLLSRRNDTLVLSRQNKTIPIKPLLLLTPTCAATQFVTVASRLCYCNVIVGGYLAKLVSKCQLSLPKHLFPTSLTGQTLTRGGECLVKFPSGFGIAYSAAGVGANIIGTCSEKAGLPLKHCALQATCQRRQPRASFATKSINTSRNSWRVRHEMMMGI